MDSKVEIGKRVWHIRKKIIHKTQEDFAELVNTIPETIC